MKKILLVTVVVTGAVVAENQLPVQAVAPVAEPAVPDNEKKTQVQDSFDRTIEKGASTSVKSQGYGELLGDLQDFVRLAKEQVPNLKTNATDDIRFAYTVILNGSPIAALEAYASSFDKHKADLSDGQRIDVLKALKDGLAVYEGLEAKLGTAQSTEFTANAELFTKELNAIRKHIEGFNS